MVDPNYGEARVRAVHQAQFVLNEHLRRRPDATAPVDPNMRVLDFGCGVGRVMEAVAELGFEYVDGVDISEEMIRHASKSDFGTDVPYPKGDQISH